MSAPMREAVARPTVDVLVVGGGPAGLLAANLLGTLGISVLLVERNPTTSDDAKAISLDDESIRSLQLAGLDDAIYPIIVPGTGTKYFGRHGQPLVHARGVGYRFGHPFKNPFAQPDLERVLRQGLDRFDGVDVCFGTALVSLVDGGGRVVAGTEDSTGMAREVSARFVLGCDGGRSTVRELLSIPMTGRSFDDEWLVLDTLDDPHDERYGMHHADPGRPHLLVPGRDGRCRYEFLLRPGECPAGAEPPFDLVERLLVGYRTVAPAQVERAVSYRFNALLADRLRQGRCFLLGDAAHMMPPFAGQGLNSGIRDAVNLTWKLAEVVAGRADDVVLDSYDSERRPHARATIDLSVRLGEIVFTTDRRRAALRDLLVGVAMRTGRGQRYLSEMRYRPTTRLAAGVIVPARGACGALVGLPLPQPSVLLGLDHRRVRLDDVLGRGWSLLGVQVPEHEWEAPGLGELPRARRVDVVLDDRSARPRADREAVADADGALDTLLAGHRGRFLLVRPDRVVAAVFTAAQAAHVGQVLRRTGVRAATDPVGALARDAPPPSPTSPPLPPPLAPVRLDGQQPSVTPSGALA